MITPLVPQNVLGVPNTVPIRPYLYLPLNVNFHSEIFTHLITHIQLEN